MAKNGMWKGKWIFVTSLLGIIFFFPIFSLISGRGNIVFNVESFLSLFTMSPLTLLYFPLGIIMLFGFKAYDGIVLTISGIVWYSLLAFLSYKASHVKKHALRYVIAIIVLILLTGVGCVSGLN